MMDPHENPSTSYRSHPSRTPDCSIPLSSSIEQSCRVTHRYKCGDVLEFPPHHEHHPKKHGQIFFRWHAQWNVLTMSYQHLEDPPNTKWGLLSCPLNSEPRDTQGYVL